MLSRCHDLEILDIVIQYVAVLMMDDLTELQRASKMLFHHINMFHLEAVTGLDFRSSVLLFDTFVPDGLFVPLYMPHRLFTAKASTAPGVTTAECFAVCDFEISAVAQTKPSDIAIPFFLNSPKYSKARKAPSSKVKESHSILILRTVCSAA